MGCLGKNPGTGSCLPYFPEANAIPEPLLAVMRKLILITLSVLPAFLGGCGYDTLQSGDEQIRLNRDEIVNQYQRQAAIAPVLLDAVKSHAAQEQDMLMVLQARTQSSSIRVAPEALDDPKALAKFQAAQRALSSALSRLVTIGESYPSLQADAGFRDLKAQFEGTKNRSEVARDRYMKAVRDYNLAVTEFPSSVTAFAFGFRVKPSFMAEHERTTSKIAVVTFNVAAMPGK